MKNKNEDFWKYIEEHDIVGLQETWLDKKGWEVMEGNMPSEFTWIVQHARRDNIKGRNMGGMTAGIRKGIEIKEADTSREGIIELNLKMETGNWKVFSIYNRGGETTKLQEIRERMEENIAGNLILTGDFNARIGRKGSIAWLGEEEERNSKDRVLNTQGEELLQMIDENGLGIMNGNRASDEKGEWKFIGKMGSSVVDYVITNVETWEKIGEFKIGERTDSDHQPIEIEIEEKSEQKEGEEEETEIEIEDWSEEGIRKYRERLKDVVFQREGVQEGLEELLQKIREATTKRTAKVKRWRPGRKKWWNKECRESKTALNRKLREYKEGVIHRQEYAREKKRHKRICKESQEKFRKEEIKKIMNIKDETEIWSYIRKGGKRAKIDEGISAEEWKQHFMELLEGSERNRKRERMAETENDNIEEIKREDIEEDIKKLKKKKSAGVDGVKNEAWKYANEKVKERLRKIMNEIWKGAEWPEDWKEGIICPIHKKGEKAKVSNYRGVTLMCTAYKIYAMIVEKRLREESDRLQLLPDTQAGFRKGRSGIDNVYTLKIAVEKALNMKGGKL